MGVVGQEIDVEGFTAKDKPLSQTTDQRSVGWEMGRRLEWYVKAVNFTTPL